jgi:hypothetical protein
MQHHQVPDDAYLLLGCGAQFGIELILVHGGAVPHYLPRHPALCDQAAKNSTLVFY